MAYTDQELQLLAGDIPALSAPVVALLNSKSTQESAAALATILTRQRGIGMVQTLSGLVNMQVSNWTALQAAATVADGATLAENLAAAKAALLASDADAFVRYGTAALLAAFKHHGV